MVLKEEYELSRRIANALEPEWIHARARELGVMERLRKIDPAAMVWTLSLGFREGVRRTFVSLRRRYMGEARVTVASSSWRERFTPEFARLMRECVREALRRQERSSGSALPLAFSEFEEVLALDATVLRLDSELSKRYPATRTNHTEAAAKLHAVINVHDFRLEEVKICEEARSDQQSYKRISDWVRGKLLLLDLGYYDFSLFRRISAHDGHFLSRLKVNANPLIVEEHDTGPGRRRELKGMKLQDALDGLQRKVVEVTARFQMRKRSYNGKRSTTHCDWRVVAVRNDEEDRYHLYVTNVTRDELDASEVAEMYRLRWQVELFFKMLKSHGRIHHLNTTNQAAVQALIWAGVLAAIACMEILDTLRDKVDDDRTIPVLRFQTLFHRIAQQALRRLVRTWIPEPQNTQLEILLYEAADPNRARDSPISRVRSH